MKVETDSVIDRDQGNEETEGQTRKQLNIEWSESEWFRIYLQLARKNQDDSE